MGVSEDHQVLTAGADSPGSATAPSQNQGLEGQHHIEGAMTVKFPPAINVYWRWRSMTTVYLGPSGDDHRYAVSTSMSWKKNGMISLHDGPSPKDPVIATASVLKGTKWRDSIIQIIPRDGRNEIDITLKGDYERKHPFSMTVGPHNKLEFFEWRRSSGSEVKELKGYARGWKLVRLMGEDVGLGGKRADRDTGFASDGKAIVAVASYGTFKLTREDFKIAFVGTGLTGVFGEDWEIAVVMSALRIREVENQQAAAA